MYGLAFTPVLAAAEGTTSLTKFEDWSSLISAITAQVNVNTIVAVLAGTITACIGMVFMWWGVRKGARMLMGAFKKGKLRV